MQKLKERVRHWEYQHRAAFALGQAKKQDLPVCQSGRETNGRRSTARHRPSLGRKDRGGSVERTLEKGLKEEGRAHQK